VHRGHELAASHESNSHPSGTEERTVRATGPGRSPWSIIVGVVVAILVIAAIYFLILQPR
jgi:hypothetical protein